MRTRSYRALRVEKNKKEALFAVNIRPPFSTMEHWCGKGGDRKMEVLHEVIIQSALIAEIMPYQRR